jgi:hypothetical protein
MFGYFSTPDLQVPDYDPGLSVSCPACNHMLHRPVLAISLMVPGDGRSYFYRVHKECYDSLSHEKEIDIDSILIDAIYHARQSD